MDGQHVGAAEQLVFAHVGGTGLRGGLGGQVGAPRDDVHAEGRPDPRHPAADPAQPEHTQYRAAQLATDRRLPAAGAHRERFVDDPAGGGQDQRPGQLDGRLDVAACRADVDAAFFGRRDVDGRVERPGGCDHLQSRQTLDDAARQGRSLPHHAHHVERRQPFDDGVGVGDVIGEDGDLRTRGHLRPVGRGERDVLVVVEDRDFHCAVQCSPKALPAAGSLTPKTKGANTTSRSSGSR